MALTANRYDERFAAGWQLPLPVAANTRIFKGGFVCLNAAGYLVPASDTAGLRCVGVARDGSDNSTGNAGDKAVVVVTQGSIIVGKSGAVNADLGKTAFCLDDETVALGTTNSITAGLIVAVEDSTHVRVRYDANCA